jgi:hypothetical protein
MSERLTTDELDELANLYAPRFGDDKLLPASVARRSAQIRALIKEVKMWRESAGEGTNG